MAYDINNIMAKENAMRDPKNVEEWARQREMLRDYLLPISTAENVSVGKISGFCPYIIFVRLDALKREDWPNNIAENSIYIDFEIDLYNKKVSVFRSGSVWLSPYDKTLPQYKYLCMKSMQNVLVDNGGKKFRKQSYKDMKDLANKMQQYYAQVMEAVNDYTDGYPYKQGTKQAA
jgi:hypothetical protein